MALWLVRCGRHGEGENVALGSGVVGVGWAELGDLSTASSLQEMRDRIVPHHPDAKPRSLAAGSTRGPYCWSLSPGATARRARSLYGTYPRAPKKRLADELNNQ